MNRFFFAALAVIFLTIPVMAQDTTVTLGELIQPWMQLLLAFFAVVIPAAATWAAAELRRRTGIALEVAHMTTFQTALENGAGLILAKAQTAADGVNIDVRHPAVRDAIRYVNAAAPDAIAYFGLTPEAIAEKIVAKLGLAQNKGGDTMINVTNEAPK